MPHLYFWIVTCVLGWTSLQADVLVDSSEAHHCRPKLIEEIPVPVSVYGFVYNDSAKTTPGVGSLRNGYRVTSPIIFNSSRSLKSVVYDSKTGELIVPKTSAYEITYSVTPLDFFKKFDNFLPVYKSSPNAPRFMALAINGKEIQTTRIEILNNFSTDSITATFVLELNKDDAVSLILPGAAPSGGFYLSRKDAGISTSLQVRNL
jgi:hypothetical protein